MAFLKVKKIVVPAGALHAESLQRSPIHAGEQAQIQPYDDAEGLWLMNMN